MQDRSTRHQQWRRPGGLQRRAVPQALVRSCPERAHPLLRWPQRPLTRRRQQHPRRGPPRHPRGRQPCRPGARWGSRPVPGGTRLVHPADSHPAADSLVRPADNRHRDSRPGPSGRGSGGSCHPCRLPSEPCSCRQNPTWPRCCCRRQCAWRHLGQRRGWRPPCAGHA